MVAKRAIAITASHADYEEINMAHQKLCWLLNPVAHYDLAHDPSRSLWSDPERRAVKQMLLDAIDEMLEEPLKDGPFLEWTWEDDGA